MFGGECWGFGDPCLRAGVELFETVDVSCGEVVVKAVLLEVFVDAGETCGCAIRVGDVPLAWEDQSLEDVLCGDCDDFECMGLREIDRGCVEGVVSEFVCKVVEGFSMGPFVGVGFSLLDVCLLPFELDLWLVVC